MASAAGFGLVALNRQNQRRAERRTPPAGRFVDAEGASLHYVDKGTGPPVVLIHGNGTLLQDWQVSGFFETLTDTHRVIAIDRPGFGYSTRPRTRFWTPQAQAAAIAGALRQLQISDACVVGHSLASTVALALALDHPELVSRLVLISGYYYPSPRLDGIMSVPRALPLVGDIINHTVAPLLGKALRPVVDQQMYSPSAVPKRWTDEFPMDLALRPSQIRAMSSDSAMIVAATTGIAARYSGLDVPITILAGESDRIVDPRGQSVGFHAAVPSSRLVLVPHAGHMLHHTHTSLVLEAIDPQSKGFG